MNFDSFHSLMNAPIWNAAGLAMVDFFVAAAVAWIALIGLRAVLRQAAPKWRYGAACLSLTLLVGLAGGALIRRWPERVTVPTAPTKVTATPVLDASIQTAAVVSAPSAQQTVPVPAEASLFILWQQRVVPWLPWLWVAGVPWVAVFVAMGWIGASRLRSGSRLLMDSRVLAVFQRCAAAMNVREVSIAICDRMTSPVVVGILRPIILIPPSLLTSLTQEQWEMILLHELAHVRRLDNLVNLAQRGVETFLFFHPAVWWTSRWIRLEREHCCDAAVLEQGAKAQEYAETLAVLALPGLSPHLATAAMANHELLTRMRHILGTEDLAMAFSRRKLATAGILSLTVAALVAASIQGFGSRASAGDDREIRTALEWLIQKEQAKEERTAANSADLNEVLAQLEVLIKERKFDRSTETIRRLQQIQEMLASEGAPEVKDVSESISRAIEFLKAKQSSAEWQSDASDGKDSSKLYRRKFSEEYRPVRSRKQAVYGRLKDQSWGAKQTTGAPDVSTAGDNPSAWAARQADRGAEWVRVGFDEPVTAVAVVIHESFNPGALSGVDIGLASESGGEPETESVWYSGTAEVPGDPNKRVTVIPLKSGARKVATVTVHVYEPKVSGWNEIDAIGLVDATTGAVKWATTAEASSSYGERPDLTSRSIVLDFSTSISPRPFAAVQATGAPNVSQAGDSPQAWASATPDGQDEWLELTYDPPVPAAAILVYESCNPGALAQVTVEEAANPLSGVNVSGLDLQVATNTVLTNDPQTTGSTLAVSPQLNPALSTLLLGVVNVSSKKTVWEGEDPVARTSGKGVAVISIPGGMRAIHKVKLSLKSKEVPGYNEIDAVGLLRASDGQVQWASSATASSEFGTTTMINFVPADRELKAEVNFVDVREQAEVALQHEIVVPPQSVGSGESLTDHDKLVEEYKRLVALLEESQCARCHASPWAESKSDPTPKSESQGFHSYNHDRQFFERLDRDAFDEDPKPEEARYSRNEIDKGTVSDELIREFFKAIGHRE